MNLKRVLTLLFICFYAISWSQVMNIRNWRKTEKDSLENGLLLVEEKKFLQALPILEGIYSNHPNEDYLKYTIAKCELNQPEKQELAYRYLNDIYQKNKKIPEIQYYLAQAAYLNYQFDEALAYLTAFIAGKHVKPELKKNAEHLKGFVNYAKYFATHPNGAKVFNPGNIINSEDDEFAPQMNAHKSSFIYNYCGKKSLGGRQNANWLPDEKGNYLPDIYFCEKNGEELKEPACIKNINGRGPDMVLGQSHDGRILFVYRYNEEGHGDIYQCDLIGDYYSKPYKLKGAVNSQAREGACSLSPDGKNLYFVSERTGGKGGKDLYRASLSADSSWVNVINLGDSVNTALDEESPFMHADGKTLYFSSKGRSSSGGFDIFKSLMRSKDSLFNKAENMGYPINSPGDDAFFVMSPGGENAYFSSDRRDSKGMRDIFEIELNLKGNKPSLCLLKGRTSKDGMSATMEIKIEISTKKNKHYSTLFSNSATGSYLAVLPTGDTYRLTYTLKNLEPKQILVDLSDMAGFIEKTKNIDFNSTTDIALTKEKMTKDTLSKLTATIATNTTSTLTNSVNNVVVEKPKEPLAIASKNTPTQSIQSNTLVGKESSSVIPVKENTVSSSSPTLITKSSQLKETSPPSSTLSLKSESNKTFTNNNASANPNNTYTTGSTSHKTEKDSIKTTTITASADPKLKTPIISSKPNGDALKKDSLKTPDTELSKKNKPVKKDTIIATKNSTKNNTASLGKKAAADFIPRNKIHEKMKWYCEKYGDIEVNELSFKAQISAYKGNTPYEFPNLVKLGKIDELKLGDGYTRLMLGGTFKNYASAFELVKKIVAAGHDNVYIVAIYKGERYSIEDLEAVGIFR